jgi:signal transduction histidine kinase
MTQVGRSDAAFAAMSDVVLAIASELSVEPVLRKLVDAARELVGARYAAIGVPDDDGDGFAQFLTSGLTAEQITAIGPLPRQHGLLGAMLTDTKPYRTDDITADPRFWGWPPNHPDMRSLLGVPIVARGDVVGLFYLTDKEPGFSDSDQRLIELLAAHAAIAIENARLFELTRELSVVQERTRLAHELHDAMNQTLFSLALVAETAAEAVRTNPSRAEHELETVKTLARSALTELRTAIHGLRPPALEADGLVAALGHHVQVLRRAHGLDVTLRLSGDRRGDPDWEREVFRIAQEALGNALRHAQATTVAVEVAFEGPVLVLVVRDDGIGFDPAARPVRARHLGLTSMRERARRLGGSLRITSALGAGTTVRLECPLWGEGAAPAAPAGGDHG